MSPSKSSNSSVFAEDTTQGIKAPPEKRKRERPETYRKLLKGVPKLIASVMRALGIDSIEKLESKLKIKDAECLLVDKNHHLVALQSNSKRSLYRYLVQALVFGYNKLEDNDFLAKSRFFLISTCKNGAETGSGRFQKGHDNICVNPYHYKINKLMALGIGFIFEETFDLTNLDFLPKQQRIIKKSGDYSTVVAEPVVSGVMSKKEEEFSSKDVFKSDADNGSQKSLVCDLQTPEGEPHRLGSHSLYNDPLERSTESVDSDGKKRERMMKLCCNCYRRAFAEKQTKEGFVCDLQTPKGKPHKLGSQSFTRHPLGKSTESVDANGKLTQRVMKVCHNCYQRLLKQKKRGQIADSQPPGESSHKFGSSDLTGSRPIGEKQMAAPADSEATTPFVIKMEPIEETDVSDKECHLVKHQRTEHKVNNTLPILQDPKNPSRSVLLDSEGNIDDINAVRWGCLNALTYTEKTRIKDDMREWLRLNEYKREQYTKKLEDSFEITTPLGLGPDRGRAVYAKKPIRQYEVIGPYSGKLHTDEESLHSSMKHNGTRGVLSYLFSTLSTQRAVDAFNVGNTMSLANTSQLPGHAAWADDNVASVTFGKNLTFYIALNDIEIGEELLLDYGPFYNPMSMIKKEDE